MTYYVQIHLLGVGRQTVARCVTHARSSRKYKRNLDKDAKVKAAVKTVYGRHEAIIHANQYAAGSHPITGAWHDAIEC